MLPWPTSLWYVRQQTRVLAVAVCRVPPGSALSFVPLPDALRCAALGWAGLAQVRYQQTVRDTLSVRGRTFADFDASVGTQEAARLQQLQAALAATLRLPAAAVTLSPVPQQPPPPPPPPPPPAGAGRRQLQRGQGSGPPAAGAKIAAVLVSSRDISALVQGLSFGSTLSARFGEAVQAEELPTVSTSIETRVVLPVAAADNSQRESTGRRAACAL
jgi:hypothetical protein